MDRCGSGNVCALRCLRYEVGPDRQTERSSDNKALLVRSAINSFTSVVRSLGRLVAANCEDETCQYVFI